MDETYTVGDGRAQTAIAMAKADAWKLRGWLERRAAALRREADEIDAMLVKATEQTDTWHDVIVRENAAAKRNLLHEERRRGRHD